MNFENQLKGTELFNEKIERIKKKYNTNLQEWEIDFLRQATNHGMNAAKYMIPRGSSKTLYYHSLRMDLCNLYNSIILIKLR